MEYEYQRCLGMFFLEIKDTHGEVVNITKHAHQQRTIILQTGYNRLETVTICWARKPRASRSRSRHPCCRRIKANHYSPHSWCFDHIWIWYLPLSESIYPSKYRYNFVNAGKPCNTISILLNRLFAIKHE